VIEIFDKYFNVKLNGGELKVVEAWIDLLPAVWYATYPVLGLMRAGLLAYTGAFEACVRLVDEIEQRLVAAESGDTDWQLAMVMAVRCIIACVQNDLARAESYADYALRELPEEDVGFRPAVYGTLGDAYRRNGRWGKAKESYLKALELTHAPAVRLHSAHVFGALADLELRQGRLQNASVYWRKALAAIREQENWGRLPLPVIGWVYIRMGELLYEWNQLSEAWDHVSRGLERAELGGDVRALIAGYLIAARLKLTEGNVETAAEYLERVRPLVEQAQFPEWTSQYERFQLEFWLTQDRLRAAVNWSDEMLRSPVLEERPEGMVAQLAMARVLIVKGDAPSLAKARVLIERLLQTAEKEGQTRVTIEALALKALAHSRRGEPTGAMTSLEHALRLAEPEGYVRLFADLGLPLARLLQEARSRAVMPDYVERLLTAFRNETAISPTSATRLPEPLTEREIEVLRLLAAGLTNREIAKQLVVSPETVKKHIANIYGKLGTGNRTETVARARQLDLLE
jgi:LuxR family maltose regulon positive regulatory protein